MSKKKGRTQERLEEVLKAAEKLSETTMQRLDFDALCFNDFCLQATGTRDNANGWKSMDGKFICTFCLSCGQEAKTPSKEYSSLKSRWDKERRIIEKAHGMPEKKKKNDRDADGVLWEYAQEDFQEKYSDLAEKYDDASGW